MPDSVKRSGGELPAVRRRNAMDALLIVGVVITAGAGAWAAFAGSTTVVIVAVVLLAVLSVTALLTRMAQRPDHIRALQSDRLMQIANACIVYLREGLDETSAAEVCQIVLRETAAEAVGITDRERVLGFAGVGEDHHLVGGPVITRATMESLDVNESRVLHTKREIGCPKVDCELRAAIVVPLEMRDRAVGTLKFYYTADQSLNETQLAMAEGLARLLSRQLELSELERQADLATQMELKALQAQINPHFLFNTINTIAAFIRTDPAEARRLLRRFGTFYRRTLEQADDLVTIGRELENVENYVELESARFGDRLVYSVDADEDLLDAALPAFMIQPIVENSVGHGMREDGSTLHVSVNVRTCPDGIWISVTDDGTGIAADRLPKVLDSSTSTGLGIALRNVHDRLKGHFGPASRFEVDSTEGVGTEVRLIFQPVAKEPARVIDD